MRKISFTSPITLDDNLKTTSALFLLLTLIYQAVNLIALHLNCYIVSFYTDKNYLLY